MYKKICSFLTSTTNITDDTKNKRRIIIESNLPSKNPIFLQLDLKDKLPKIREELEKYDCINDNSLFLKKYDSNGDKKFAEIPKKSENYLYLHEVINENEMILHLNLQPNCEYFNEKCKLDYGCIMTSDEIKKAEERAFIMKNCKLIEIGPKECKSGSIEFGSKEDEMMKKNLFFGGEI